MSNKKFDLFKRLEELPSKVYVILAIFCIVIHVILCTYTDISVATCGLVLIVIYMIAAFAIHLTVNKRISFFRRASTASEEQNSGVIYTFRNMLKLNGTGKFLWEKLLTGAEREELIGALLAEYEVEEARAAADVDAFLATLGELGVLEAE